MSCIPFNLAAGTTTLSDRVVQKYPLLPTLSSGSSSPRRRCILSRGRAVVREDAQLVAELEAGELGSSEVGANIHPRQVSNFKMRFAGADVFPRTSLYKK